MIKHIMADGTKRDSIEGYIIPKDISKSLLNIIAGKEKENGNSNTSGDIKEK